MENAEAAARLVEAIVTDTTTWRDVRRDLQAIRTSLRFIRGFDAIDRTYLTEINDRIERIDRQLFEAWLEGLREEVA